MLTSVESLNKDCDSDWFDTLWIFKEKMVLSVLILRIQLPNFGTQCLKKIALHFSSNENTGQGLGKDLTQS